MNTADARQVYSDPGLVVYPSGQTIPVNYYQNGSAPTTTQLPYMPANMYTGYFGSAGLPAATMQGYPWPYAITPAVSGVDPARRPSSSSEEYASPPQTANPDYYAPVPYMQMTASQSQHYIAGPIQPMKCADNKSYEMVNLDELVSREPPIPRAVPALWTNQEELSLAKSLQNPEGITNVYIRGFMPDTTDQDLEQWASRFGEIESCKAIIEQDTGKCKGFGFVMYYSPAAAENCIRGFFHLGFQASYAQKSRNSRLKDLEDRMSTNIYCTGVPIEWNESVSLSAMVIHTSLLTTHRTWPTTSVLTTPSLPRSVVTFLPGSAKKLASPGKLSVWRRLHQLTQADLRLVRLLSVSFASITATSSSMTASSSASASPTLRPKNSSSCRARNVATGAAASTAILLSTPLLQPCLASMVPVIISVLVAAISLLLELALTSLLQRPSLLRKSRLSAPTSACTSVSTGTSTDLLDSEANGSNKTMPNARANAWPLQGGLQSITNTSNSRDQAAAGVYVDIAAKHSTVEVIPETAEVNINTKTPEKITIKVEPASGKENVSTA